MNEPVPKSLVLITCLNSEHPDESAHSYTRQSRPCSHTYSKDVGDDSGKQITLQGPLDSCIVCIKNVFKNTHSLSTILL